MRLSLAFALLILATLLPAPSANAQPGANPISGAAVTVDDLQGTLSPFIHAQLERRRIAGAVVVIVKEGAVLLEQGYGFADVAARRAMDRFTPTRIGSITKLLTALAVMQLVDGGRVSLDEDVNRYLDFRLPVLPGRPAVTLRRLLSHRTGFEDRIGGIGTAGAPIDPGRFLATRAQPRLGQDDVVAYANYNAAIAARVVERVSGQRFEQYLGERVFAPLGMTTTTAVQPATPASQTSLGYVRSDAPPTRVSMAADVILEVGSTGVVAPGADMTRLLRALLETAPGVVSRSALDQMMTGQTRVPLGFMGLGIYSPLGAGGNAFVGHEGGTGAFQSVVALLPDAAFGLFASYNSDGVREALTPTAELLQFVATRYFPRQRSEPPRLDAIAGTYAPTRRVESSLFRLRLLLQQVSIDPAAGGFSIRPSAVPFGQPLANVAPGVFAWAGRDVAFIGSGDAALMQIGSPPAMFRRVPWWENASWVIPAVAGGLLVSFVSTVTWPIGILRGKYRERPARWSRLIVRLALLLYIVAWTLGLWMVLVWWPNVALSSPAVMPITLVIYSSAWTAVLLTPLAVWQAAMVRREARTGWATVREVFLIVLLVVLAVLSVYWRIAGVTLAL